MQLSWSLPSTGRCLFFFHSSLLFSICPVCFSDPAVTQLMLTQSKSWFLCKWSQENHTEDSPSAEWIKGPHEHGQPGVQCGEESLRQKQWKGGAGCRRNGITTSDRNSSTSALLGLHLWGKEVTCIMYRNMVELICSTGNDTTMKSLHPLPLSMMSILLFPGCMTVVKTLGSAYCRCAAVGWDPAWVRAAGVFAVLTVIPHCPAPWLSHGVWGYVGCVTLVHDHLASWRSLSRCIGNKRNTSHP